MIYLIQGDAETIYGRKNIENMIGQQLWWIKKA